VEIEARAAEEKTKLAERLDAQVAAKKLTAAECKDRLAQHDELWRSKTENTIAQKIERAHLYSFNLANYRSSLIEVQLAAWNDVAATYLRENDQSKNLESQFRAISTADPDQLDELLSGLDGRHTLELDIARQFLSEISPEFLTKYPHLRTLQDIIASQQRASRVQLKELIEPRFEKITKDDYDGVLPIVEKITFSDGQIHFREERTTGMDLYRAKKGDLLTSKINIHQGAVALAPCDLVASTHYQPYAIRVPDVNPDFLVDLLRTPQFVGLLSEQKNKGIKSEQGADFLGDFEIPLLSIEHQERAASFVARKDSLIKGAQLVLSQWKIEPSLFTGTESPLSEIADTGTGSTPSRTNPAYFGGDVNWVLTCEVLENDIRATAETLTKEAFKDYVLRIYPPDTILVAMYGQGATRGKAALLRVPAAITQNCAGIVINRSDVLRRYVYYFLRSMYEVIRGQEYTGGGVPHLNLTIVSNFRVPIPSLGEQRRVISELDTKMKLLDDLRELKHEAKRSIEETLNRIWES
jgi:hypothetical protein